MSEPRSALLTPAAIRNRSSIEPNCRWTIVKNTAAQLTGRNLIALCRLVVAGIIVRSYGSGTFGEYSLIFGILSVAEWLVDFGATDFFVREISREPERGQRLLRLLTAAKFVQVPAACAMAVALLLALRYPARVVEAGLVGTGSLVFFAGVLVYRVLFRASLTIEREVAAELFSVLAMIPLIFLVSKHGGGLTALMGCHVISRAVFFGLCIRLGKSRYRLSVNGVTGDAIRSSLRSASAFGTIGLFVVVYEALDILLLSKLGSRQELAYYSGAQRLVWPMLLGLASIGGTLYPIAASYWPQARSQFEEACQRGLDTVVLLAGVGVSSLLAAPEFFMGLLGPDLVPGAPALRVLALLCLAKAVSSTLGPVLFVVHAQRRALQFIVIAVVVKAAVIAALVTRFGYMGVAFGALGVEVCFAGVPLILLLQRYSGYRLRWIVPVKVGLVIGAAAAIPRLLLPANGLAVALAALAVYIPLSFLSGAVRLSDVRSLLQWKTS